MKIQKGIINMKSYFTSIKFIIMLLMITSVSFGADQLDEVMLRKRVTLLIETVLILIPRRPKSGGTAPGIINGNR